MAAAVYRVCIGGVERSLWLTDLRAITSEQGFGQGFKLRTVDQRSSGLQALLDHSGRQDCDCLGHPPSSRLQHGGIQPSAALRCLPPDRCFPPTVLIRGAGSPILLLRISLAAKQTVFGTDVFRAAVFGVMASGLVIFRGSGVQSLLGAAVLGASRPVIVGGIGARAIRGRGF